ncbi:MAG: phosphoribosylglycinamide formyltransferase [Acidobacteria bacterium]|nr:phosphoribosylglycinamide formyltransferase [Acidobacteriota bacterium]
MSADGRGLGVLLSGRGSNFVAIAERIRRGDLAARVDLVVSNKADAPGLGAARDRGIDAVFLDPRQHPTRAEYDLAVADALRARDVDLVCLAGWMRILTPEFIQQFPGRILNIHPALLPSFPGLHAQRQALEYGVKVSGCTVHFVDAGVDTGPIILQQTVPVQDEDTEESLSARILEREHDTYWRAIRTVLSGRVVVRGRRVTFGAAK